MTAAITKKQQAVLDFIKSNIKERGFPPTTYEIAHAFGWKSDNAAHEHLKRLQAKGFICLARGAARAITVIGEEKPDPEEMAGALRVISTWAACDRLDPAFVLNLCNKALRRKTEAA